MAALISIVYGYMCGIAGLKLARYLHKSNGTILCMGIIYSLLLLGISSLLVRML